MVFAHVIYKKTGLERQTTVKAYNLLKNQYTLLGYVDENGNPVQGPEEQQPKSKTTQKKSVAPAVNEPRKQMSPEEIESKKAELRAMNEAAIQKAKEEQAKENVIEAESRNAAPSVADLAITKPRQKPGPKPKQHA